MSIGPTHGQNEYQQHIAHILHARSHILITNTYKLSHVMSNQQAMCPLLHMRLLIGEHYATV
jgi:hypothetical protein